jgi:hypothetical protein
MFRGALTLKIYMQKILPGRVLCCGSGRGGVDHGMQGAVATVGDRY